MHSTMCRCERRWAGDSCLDNLKGKDILVCCLMFIHCFALLVRNLGWDRWYVHPFDSPDAVIPVRDLFCWLFKRDFHHSCCYHFFHHSLWGVGAESHWHIFAAASMKVTHLENRVGWRVDNINIFMMPVLFTTFCTWWFLYVCILRTKGGIFTQILSNSVWFKLYPVIRKKNCIPLDL